MIITIDGPAGVGKSTVAKLLAQKLKFSYFDTGAMYRAVTYAFLKNEIDIDDEKSVLDFLQNSFKYEIKEENGLKFYYVNSEDVTEIIRSNYVTEQVSGVSAKPFVRKTLVPMQRKIANEKDIVCEGRDMGTVVFPNAGIKIYLTAKISVRAQRRFEEYIEKHPQDIATLDKNQILLDIQRRDEKDSTRQTSPLRKAKDAYHIDTSSLNADGVVKKIIKRIKKQKKTKFAYRVVRVVSRFVLKTFYKYKVYGKENIIKGAAIVTSNHVSFFDPSVLTVAIEEEIHFLAKESLFKTPILKYIISALNAHPISGKEANIQTIKEVKNILKTGKKIVIFPEGTRTDGKITKLLPGVGFLISLSKCTTIPTYIYGAHKVWPRGKKFPKLFGQISCIFGKPIKFEEFEKIDRNKRIPFILARIENELKNLEKWAEEGFKGDQP
ncbi:MAG: Cytidylate kinase [Candidatus Anoxychlamydiales bacterium]|nr:Cytidylate kinase [Candidatus Anoxychlamydiales bacterium]